MRVYVAGVIGEFYDLEKGETTPKCVTLSNGVHTISVEASDEFIQVVLKLSMGGSATVGSNDQQVVDPPPNLEMDAKEQLEARTESGMRDETGTEML